MNSWFKEAPSINVIDGLGIDEDLLNSNNPYASLVGDVEDFEKIIIEIPVSKKETKTPEE